MPKGPRDFPRITNIGPFSELKAEQEFQHKEENTFIVGTDIDREIATIHDVDIDDVQEVESKLIIRAEVDKEPDDILHRVRSELDTIFRDNNIAMMDYWYDPDNQIAKIFDVKVQKQFRRRGIATTLKELELEYMRDQGVNVVYTDVISIGGYRLATTTGFKPITHATHLDPEQADSSMLSYYPEKDRGIMFKYL
jgi:ribosomal protein S18 acetylase RimI-like enzyme